MRVEGKKAAAHRQWVFTMRGVSAYRIHSSDDRFRCCYLAFIPESNNDDKRWKGFRSLRKGWRRESGQAAMVKP